MDNLIRMLNPRDIDEVTLAEIRHFITLKLDEQAKIKGRIAHDLSRIGEYAFQEPSAYTKLKGKYRAAKSGKKKFAILELMRQNWSR